eukprot:9383-Heterococcus_DN1.PRE.2
MHIHGTSYSGAYHCSKVQTPCCQHGNRYERKESVTEFDDFLTQRRERKSDSQQSERTSSHLRLHTAACTSS